jgi:SAM-dependent methyltransferase
MKKILSEKLVAFYAAHASDKKTLDVGSRRQRHAAWFPNAITVDIDPKSNPDIVADAHALPFEDGTFEIVILREVLEHVRDPRQVLSELHRVLKPGGQLLLSTRFLFPIHEAPVDRWRFTRYLLIELLEAWEDVVVVDEVPPFTAIGCLIERFVWQSDFKYANKVIKGILMVCSRACMKLDSLVVRQYGDVGKITEIPSAFTTGYYVTAKKSPSV